MKRLLLQIIGLSLACILGAGMTAYAANRPRIAAILSSESNEFWAGVWQGVRFAAREHGISLSEYVYSHTSPEELIRWIDTAIYARVDGVILRGSGDLTEEIQNALKKAKAQGLYIVTVDVDATPRDAFFGLDNTEAAILLAKGVVDIAPSQARIVIVGYDTTSAAVNRRVAAFSQYVTDARPDIRIERVIRGHTYDGGVEDIMEFLSDNQDISIVFSGGPIYLNNAAIAIARLETGSPFHFFGFYEKDYNLKDISPHIHAVLVRQNPYEMGREAMECMHLLLSGEDLAQDVFLIPFTLTKEG